MCSVAYRDVSCGHVCVCGDGHVQSNQIPRFLRHLALNSQSAMSFAKSAAWFQAQLQREVAKRD